MGRRKPLEPYLSIVIPAYNEERRIGPSLDSIIAYAGRSKRPVEIIVVDDGSSDRTADTARRALGLAPTGPAASGTARVLSNEMNRGKGFSVRRGVLAARGKVALVSDADLSTPVEEADRLLEHLERMGRGMVIGSRALRESRIEVRQNIVREMMGKSFNQVVRGLTGLPFHDTQCGFKLMTRDEVAPILARARIDGFSYDVELLYVAARRGIRIREVGVIWRNAPGSKVGILSDPLRMLRDVWRVRRWYRQGVYDSGT